MPYRKEGSVIAAALRYRICMMQSITEDIILHEGALATEFGVSRTPIRQVLQKLAYERLVQTRSGVGTIVAPLDRANRDHDLGVLRALFRAAADCSDGVKLDPNVPMRLALLAGTSEAVKENAAAYLELRSELLEISGDCAPDDILADAIRAAHWRHVRWRMADAAWDEPGCFDNLKASVANCAEAARTGDPRTLLLALSEARL